MTTVNFNQVLQDAKSASFEALPVGDYDVEVDKADAVTSSNGRPMIKTTFKVVVGPHTNRKVINNFVLVVDNPTALAIFFRNMKAMGLTDEFFASLGASGTLDPVAQTLVGRRARLKLGQREWNGEMRNEVNQVMPYTGAPGAGGSGPAAGPGGPSLTGVPSPGPAAYATAGPTPSPAPAAAPMPTPAPAPAPAPATPQPAPSTPSEAASTSVDPAPAPPSAPAPPALPI